MSKEEIAAVKHLRAKYPYIVAWGRYTGMSEQDITGECISANAAREKETVVYAALDPENKQVVWIHIHDIGMTIREKLHHEVITSKGLVI